MEKVYFLDECIDVKAYRDADPKHDGLFDLVEEIAGKCGIEALL